MIEFKITDIFLEWQKVSNSKLLTFSGLQWRKVSCSCSERFIRVTYLHLGTTERPWLVVKTVVNVLQSLGVQISFFILNAMSEKSTYAHYSTLIVWTVHEFFGKNAPIRLGLCAYHFPSFTYLSGQGGTGTRGHGKLTHCASQGAQGPVQEPGFRPPVSGNRNPGAF